MGDPTLSRVPIRAAVIGVVVCVALATPACTALGMARRALREPGAKLLELPDEVAARYECTTRRLPYFVFEHQEVNPNRVEAGDEFNHRFVYALCPRRTTEVIPGDLRTRILFRNRVVAHDRVQGFELQPGRWAVDSFVRLPPDAAPGVYALELDFSSAAGVSFRHTATFGVEPSQ